MPIVKKSDKEVIESKLTRVKKGKDLYIVIDEESGIIVNARILESNQNEEKLNELMIPCTNRDQVDGSQAIHKVSSIDDYNEIFRNSSTHFGATKAKIKILFGVNNKKDEESFRKQYPNEKGRLNMYTSLALKDKITKEDCLSAYERYT